MIVALVLLLEVERIVCVIHALAISFILSHASSSCLLLFLLRRSLVIISLIILGSSTTFRVYHNKRGHFLNEKVFLDRLDRRMLFKSVHCLENRSFVDS